MRQNIKEFRKIIIENSLERHFFYVSFFFKKKKKFNLISIQYNSTLFFYASLEEMKHILWSFHHLILKGVKPITDLYRQVYDGFWMCPPYGNTWSGLFSNVLCQMQSFGSGC